MDIKECKEQLHSLIEHFNNGGLDINATDINAIKLLLEENKKLHLRDTYANITHNQFQIEKQEKRYYENMLNELEKWLKSNEVSILNTPTIQVVLEKLKRLKGSDK